MLLEEGTPQWLKYVPGTQMLEEPLNKRLFPVSEQHVSVGNSCGSCDSKKKRQLQIDVMVFNSL